LVIGAGSGGLGAARRAAMFGKKVAMVESKEIGGTCVNVGCVPKKIMYNAANFIDDAHLFSDYGVNVLENVKIDFPSFKKNRDAYIQKLNTIYHKNADNSGIQYLNGAAKFISPKEIEVVGKEGSKERFSADHILVASGSKSIIPSNLPGVEHCITSDDIFAMD
jgi:glutathione reductase (NADPH)